MKDESNDKILWSLDLAVTLEECDLDKFNENSLPLLARKLTEVVDQANTEIVGIVNPFGAHNEDMKGWRLIHENLNSLITGHFILKSKKAYVNIHSCNPYKPSEAIFILTDFFGTDKFISQKIYRE